MLLKSINLQDVVKRILSKNIAGKSRAELVNPGFSFSNEAEGEWRFAGRDNLGMQHPC